MSNRLVLVLLSAVLLLGSCSRKLLPGRSATAPSKTPEMVKAINVDFRYLKAKGKVAIDFPGLQQTANLNVRVRRDSVIWLSASLGIEGFRAYITRDSVKVLFPLQREYYAGDYAYLSRVLNVPVTFERLQALLLGDYLPASPPDITPTVATENGMQRVQYEQRGLVVQQLIDVAKARVQQLSVQEQASQNSVTVDYSDFQPLPPRNQLFAHALLLNLKQPKSTAPATVTVNYRNVDLDKERLSFPFSVPKGYARKK